jgi:FkbM family methyltransferase
MTKRGIPLVTLGEANQWTLSEAGLNPNSKVLCAGAGHDISFEKALIARYGCKVVLLDPSPTGIATVQRENIPPERLNFMAVGLTGRDGTLNFAHPEDSMEGSFHAQPAGLSGGLQFNCKSLSTLMSELKWNQIDLLKFDIEGCEYDVIQDLLEKQLPVKQICAEFHYGLQFDHTRGEMIQKIMALRRGGYDLIHQIHRDHTFLLRSRKM